MSGLLAEALVGGGGGGGGAGVGGEAEGLLVSEADDAGAIVRNGALAFTRDKVGSAQQHRE